MIPQKCAKKDALFGPDLASRIVHSIHAIWIELNTAEQCIILHYRDTIAVNLNLIFKLGSDVNARHLHTLT